MTASPFNFVSTTAVQPSANRSGMSLLLAQYLSGKINEKTWKRLMAFLDAAGFSGPERDAFALYLIENIKDAGDSKIPAFDEDQALMHGVKGLA